MSTISKLSLPSLSREQVARMNRQAAWRPPLPLPGIAEFALHRIEEPASEPDPGPDRLKMGLLLGDDPLTVLLPRALALDLLKSVEPNLRLEPLPPPDLLALLLDATITTILETWEQAAGRLVRVHDVVPAGDAAPEGPACVLSLRGPGLRQTISVFGSDEALDRLLRPWPAEARPLASLPVPTALHAGTTVLDAKLVASLRPGDAVLLQEGPAACTDGKAAAPCLLLVVAGALAATLRWIDNQWRLDAPPRRQQWMGHGMSETDNEEFGRGDAPSAAELDTLPVHLVFEAARFDLTLGELRRLGAGSVLELGTVPGIVSIIANGRRLGSGELVSVEGRAGVRIITLAPGLDTGGDTGRDVTRS